MNNPFSRISAFYNDRVSEFGYDPRACDYGRTASQQKKFRVLAEALDYSGLTVLDVGCGFADYASLLHSRFPKVKYSGIDLSEAMIAQASHLHPDLELRAGNLLDEPEDRKYDVVSANGIFYLLGTQAETLMRQLVAAMFERCRKGIAFNSLSTWASHHEPGEYYADPLEIVRWCRSLSPRVVLRHDYLAHDFTIYLYREEALQ